MRRGAFILAALWLSAAPSGAFADPSWQRDFGLNVIGTLSPVDQATLRTLLLRVPSGLYPSLQAIYIDDSPGYDPQSLPQVNCFSGVGLYEVCAHELGHQIDESSPARRHAWVTALIAEAGCEAGHYLRSMLPACYFVDNPQEFIASMVGEWIMDSQPMWARALVAWQAGNVHPLNQAILLTAIFGIRPAVGEGAGASVIAYRSRLPELWRVTPWQCGGPVTVVSSAWTIEVKLDQQCRVTAVTMEGT